MDVLSRLYHILRSRSGGDHEPFTNASEDNFADGSDTDWSGFNDSRQEQSTHQVQDPVLAGYYANLEIPYGSDLGTAKVAWKKMMKQYHPDLHSSDPDKRKIANELCAELTRAYQELERLLA